MSNDLIYDCFDQIISYLKVSFDKKNKFKFFLNYLNLIKEADNHFIIK